MSREVAMEFALRLPAPGSHLDCNGNLSSKFQCELAELAQLLNVTLLAQVVEHDTEANGSVVLFSTLVAISSSKTIQAKYRKHHLYGSESMVFDQPQAGGSRLRLGALSTGLLICFDLMFPFPRDAYLAAAQSTRAAPG